MIILKMHKFQKIRFEKNTLELQRDPKSHQRLKFGYSKLKTIAQHCFQCNKIERHGLFDRVRNLPE